MTNALKNICCVIVSYNSDHDIEKQIKECSEYLNLLVVDNGSGEEVVSYLKSLQKTYKFELLVNVTNIGLSKALNQGVEYARKIKATYLLTLDQDSFLSLDNINKLVEAINPEEKIVSVGPYYQSPKENHSFVNFLITSGNLVSLSVFDDIGVFDDQLFIDQIDIEFSFRLLINGYKMLMVGGSSIAHKIGNLERSYIFKIRYYSHSPQRFYYMYRNERYLNRKYAKKLKWICFKSRVAAFLYLFKIIFLERNKIVKLKSIFKGYHDGKKLIVN